MSKNDDTYRPSHEGYIIKTLIPFGDWSEKGHEKGLQTKRDTTC